MTQLSLQAMGTIHDYLHLPFGHGDISCPYYNNRRGGLRGSLAAIVGKGSAQEIVDEAQAIALGKKVSLNSLSADELKKFLVDHDLGIDCSGLAYHILESELAARGLGTLGTHLRFPNIKNPIRRLLVRLRPAQNTSVGVLADDANSTPVALDAIQPGDMIIMLRSGINHDRDHVLIVHDVSNITREIAYTHALDWRIDGLYGHGVRQGTITVTDPTKPLVEQQWTEQGKTGVENETRERAAHAAAVEIRRLRILA